MEHSKSSLIIEKYSEKSFIVKGDSRNFKDELTNMGGKWNSCLTNKTTGEKFGAWLFWSGKKQEIENWLKSSSSSSVEPSTSYLKRIENMEQILCKMISLFETSGLNDSSTLNETNFYKSCYKKRAPSTSDEYLSDDGSCDNLISRPRLLKRT